MGDYSRYVGKLPEKETTVGDMRRQNRLTQEETRRMIEAVRREMQEQMNKMEDSLTAVRGRVTNLEEQAADPVKGFDALDERVTAFEEAQE